MRPRSRTNRARVLDVPLTTFQPASRKMLLLALSGIFLLGFSELVGESQTRVSENESRRAVLQVRFELASDFAPSDTRQRDDVLSMLEERGSASDQERTFAHAAFRAAPDSKYRSLAPAQTIKADAYVLALGSSYARYRGALVSGDKGWSAKQLKAAQEYARLAADALLAESQQDDQDVVRLQRIPFAVRRSSADEAAFVEGLKKSGLSPELHKLLQVGGLSETEIAAFQQRLLKLPPEEIGTSPAEMLSGIAETRRELADELGAFASAMPGSLARRSAQTLVVSNPHDKEETIDLVIRPISIPPDWKLSVMNEEEQSKFKVREIEQGRRYAVTLPAQAQVRVASVVVPVGEVGTNTTARWAVEGKIGDELIGGMVHEMNVPYIIADLKLPPVGSKEEEEELPAPWKAWPRIVAEVAAAIIVLALLAYFFILRRRRRHTDTPSRP